MKMKFVKNINEILHKLFELQKELENTINQTQQSLNQIKETNGKSKSVDEKITEKETLFNNLIDVNERRETIITTGKELIENFCKETNKLFEKCIEKETEIKSLNNQLADEIIELKEQKRIEEIEYHYQQIKEINKRYDEEKHSFNKKRMETENEKIERENKMLKKEIDYIHQNAEEMIFQMKQQRIENGDLAATLSLNLSKEEKNKLEEWTNKKISSIVFDSNEDNWNSNSLFNSKVNGKKDLIFLVETNDGNKFGGYTSEKISIQENVNLKIKKENSFLFSLKSNSHQKGMIQFKQKVKIQQNGGFGFGGFGQPQPSSTNFGQIPLFSFEDDLVVQVKSGYLLTNKSEYDYQGIENPFFCLQKEIVHNQFGTNYKQTIQQQPYPKRIMVFQMK